MGEEGTPKDIIQTKDNKIPFLTRDVTGLNLIIYRSSSNIFCPPQN